MRTRDPIRRLVLPRDTYERYRIAARLAQEPVSLLDVGGISKQLQAFLPDTRVTTLNIEGEKAERHFGGDRLPFADGSFEVVTSLDVLEHIPASERRRHIDEIVRVSGLRAVLCCPLGGPTHVSAERELAEWYVTRTGSEHRFLSEHLSTGLPDPAELETLASESGRNASIRFHGDFRRVGELFKKSTEARLRPRPSSIAGYARARLDPRGSLELEDHFNTFTNRAFMVLDVGDGDGNG